MEKEDLEDLVKGVSKKSASNVVTKKYDLINAKYSLTALESKIALTVISMVRKEDEAFFMYQIPIKNFDYLTKDKNHSLLKKTCLNLMRKPLQVQEGSSWIIFNWFSSIRYEGKEGMLYFKVSDDLKPYLLQLKESFKSYDLKYIINMKSEYSIRIYELLKQYEKIGHRFFDIKELREVLEVPKSYLYSNMKRKVLNIALKEINQFSDIYINFEEIKPSRSVTGLKFNIIPNIENSKDDKKFLKWVNLMRETYVNQEIIYYPDLEANVRINTKGYLYLDNGQGIKHDKAKTFWKWAYKNQDKLLTPKLKF